MNLIEIVFREILYRRTNFILAAVSVGLALSTFLGSMAILRSFDTETEKLTQQSSRESTKRLAALEDEIRKSMKGLGFNIHIYPKDQEMSEVYSLGYASKTMPESYVDQLANTEIVTINHLLPSLVRKLTWPEKERTILLIGIRGEVPILERDPKSPMIDPVSPGTVVMGSELHRSLGISKGDTVTLMGHNLKVAACEGERGTVDDITIWMHLKEMQSLLGMEGKINEIRALECNCTSIDRLGEVRVEIQRILPDTQIIEVESKALARAEARIEAQRTSEEQLIALANDRDHQRKARERHMAWLIPMVGLLALGGLFFLTFQNSQERSSEIATFRAIGIRSRTILFLFLGRALFVGITGGMLSLILFNLLLPFDNNLSLLEWLEAWSAGLVLAVMGSWVPALAASGKDPAAVLREGI